MTKSKLFLFLVCCWVLNANNDGKLQGTQQWTVVQANQWSNDFGWFAGANFIPSNAVNILEMWQAETYDPVTIDRELGFAASAGMRVIRVFIHHLLWQQNPNAFLLRMDNFLSLADSHGIKTMFVMFDDCWNPEGQLGTQPLRLKGIHNSQWIQAPGLKENNDQSLFPLFQKYFLGVIGRFRNDNRILLWDLYNEAGNSNHGVGTLPLLMKAFEWARSANPSQPVSSGPWNFAQNFQQINDFILSNSDVITFHLYNTLDTTRDLVQSLKISGRPVICTEYMARTLNSKFQTHIPMFHQENVGAINWGLVSGKTNTIYPWDSKLGSEEPKIWFHDILRQDGSPFDQEEINVIKYHTALRTQLIE